MLYTDTASREQAAALQSCLCRQRARRVTSGNCEARSQSAGVARHRRHAAQLHRQHVRHRSRQRHLQRRLRPDRAQAVCHIAFNLQVAVLPVISSSTVACAVMHSSPGADT